MLDANDLGSIDTALGASDLAGVDPVTFVQTTIDFLNGIRENLKHGAFSPGKWLLKQALDSVIAALHQWAAQHQP